MSKYAVVTERRFGATIIRGATINGELAGTEELVTELCRLEAALEKISEVGSYHPMSVAREALGKKV